MNEDMSELMNKLNDMLNSDSSSDLKNLINNFANNSDNKSSDTSDYSNNSNHNSNNNDDDDEFSNFNIDFETIMKIKTMMDALNTKKDDPRAKLLKSLKPYLKESRKNKVDQYIGLLNMSQVFELFKNSGGDENAGIK